MLKKIFRRPNFFRIANYNINRVCCQLFADFSTKYPTYGQYTKKIFGSFPETSSQILRNLTHRIVIRCNPKKKTNRKFLENPQIKMYKLPNNQEPNIYINDIIQ